jgi:glycolate oxidase iron-sulfur subunit
MEADSPRGRIRQMLLVDQGRLPLGESFRTHIDRCLDCRACETACPSGVEYGKLVEAARAEIERNLPRPLLARLARDVFFRRLLPHPRRIAIVARMLRLYQRSGIQRAVRATGVLKLFGLAERERLLPEIDREFFFSRLGATYPAAGARRARVAFFAGCMAQVMFTRLNDATIRVLTANGCEVVVPAGQLCCGALAVHAGERDAARRLARANLQAFLAEEFDAVITNAAGCGSTLKEYAQLFPAECSAALPGGSGAGLKPGGPKAEFAENYERARQFAARVKDVTEFLDALGLVAPLGEVKLRVTYQDSCHLAHGQRIREAPRRLLRAIPGVELREMRLPDQCCGSAGIYNVTQPETAAALLEEKMADARATGAAAVVTANPGCILQLRAGVARHGPPAAGPQEVLHVVELLARAINAP